LQHHFLTVKKAQIVRILLGMSSAVGAVEKLARADPG